MKTETSNEPTATPLNGLPLLLAVAWAQQKRYPGYIVRVCEMSGTVNTLNPQTGSQDDDFALNADGTVRRVKYGEMVGKPWERNYNRIDERTDVVELPLTPEHEALADRLSLYERKRFFAARIAEVTV